MNNEAKQCKEISAFAIAISYQRQTRLRPHPAVAPPLQHHHWQLQIRRESMGRGRLVARPSAHHEAAQGPLHLTQQIPISFRLPQQPRSLAVGCLR